MAARQAFRALIMGAPGSGKGTIAKRIITDFDMTFLSSGDVLRNEILQKTEIGMTCDKYIKNGALVPENVIQDLILSHIRKINDKDWLLDGFPRTLAQAEALLDNKLLPDVVVDLNVPFEVIIERIKGRWTHLPSGRVYNIDFNKPKVPFKDDVTGEALVQRVDDQPETVMARLQAYKNQSMPVSDYFRKKGILKEFQGRESNEMWPHIRKYLSTLRKPVKEVKYT